MRNGLPSPGRKSKFATKLAATLPQRFHVVVSRVVSPDRLETAVAGDFDGSRASVERHARTVASSIATRFEVPACVDVTDSSGHPVFSYATGTDQ